jgi:hypothetical protein
VLDGIYISTSLSFQALRSPAIPLTSFHNLPVFLILFSVVLRHVLFGLTLLLYPWGFQSNAVFSITPASLRNVCPIQFHFLLFILISIGFCLVILHISSFVIFSVYFIFIIRPKHLFINVCNLLIIWLVVFQVSQAYNRDTLLVAQLVEALRYKPEVRGFTHGQSHRIFRAKNSSARLPSEGRRSHVVALRHVKEP